MKTKIAVVVPFYNEKNNLKFFVKEWENFISPKKKLNFELFFFFIDDGSTDNSQNILKKSINNLKYKIIQKKNSGHGDTCRFGYNLIINRYNHYDYLLQIDSDNQCNPEYLLEINKLIKKKKYSFIFGHRKQRNDGFVRFVISKIMSLTFFIKKLTYINDLNTPYRIMRVNKLKYVLSYIAKKKYNDIELFNCVVSYAVQKKYKIYWIDVIFRDRLYGNSKFNFFKMLKMYINLILKI
jgi:hypothetical protein